MIAFHFGLYGVCSCLFGRDVFFLCCVLFVPVCCCFGIPGLLFDVVVVFLGAGCCLLCFACGVVCLGLFYYYAVLLLVF